MQINSAKDLKAYQLAYELAMDIFLLSKGWPEEERYSLVGLFEGLRLSE